MLKQANGGVLGEQYAGFKMKNLSPDNVAGNGNYTNLYNNTEQEFVRNISEPM